MDFKKKYLKYKEKYLKLQKILIGGSYIIDSFISSTRFPNNKTEYKYQEVTILVDDIEIGWGGSGIVKSGIITECSVNPYLINKKVAIKKFNRYGRFSSNQKKTYEKDKMINFGLDSNDTLVINPHVATLYFDINTGPLVDHLIYEYGGKTLNTYYGSTDCNLENNKCIMVQLFKILNELSKKNHIMHNDVKTDNITYDINTTDGTINIKLIDFGSSMSILKLNRKEELFTTQLNMKTPETIYNYLNSNSETKLFNEIKGTENGKNYNVFDKWYYYPFISIVCYLFTGIEYSTGSNTHINNVVGIQRDQFIRHKKILEILLDNNIIKCLIKKEIKEDFKVYLPKLNELIDMVCKGVPGDRYDEDNIIEILNK
jgi:serine/threonine protein kinase